MSGTSALIWALAIGAVIANTGLLRPSLAPGIRYASRNVLRIGVALLGIRLSLGTIGDLGLRTIVVILGSICATFVATLLIGRLLGVSGPLTLLIATGTGICGASAIVAMESVSEASREEAAFALATITALGTVAMVGAAAPAHAARARHDRLRHLVGRIDPGGRAGRRCHGRRVGGRAQDRHARQAGAGRAARAARVRLRGLERPQQARRHAARAALRASASSCSRACARPASCPPA